MNYNFINYENVLFIQFSGETINKWNLELLKQDFQTLFDKTGKCN